MSFTVVLNGKIYAMGGEDIAVGGKQTNTVEGYDIATDKWTGNRTSLTNYPTSMVQGDYIQWQDLCGRRFS